VAFEPRVPGDIKFFFVKTAKAIDSVLRFRRNRSLPPIAGCGIQQEPAMKSNLAKARNSPHLRPETLAAAGTGRSNSHFGTPMCLVSTL